MGSIFNFINIRKKAKCESLRADEFPCENEEQFLFSFSSLKGKQVK